MKVVSIKNLFGINDFVCFCEEEVLVKDGLRYLPLDIVEYAGFHYLSKWVQEVDFE